MKEGYRASHLAPGKGESYHRSFVENPYRKMVWQLEQQVLDKIVESLFAGRIGRHLDFACGTGRIVTHLSGRADTSTGVDVSESMLRVAREGQGATEFHLADITQDDVLAGRKFDLITAFRFFPNAEVPLRNAAMAALVNHMESGAYLVFNNHKNSSSARYCLSRLVGHRGVDGMSLAEVQSLVSKNGLEIVQVHHMCVCPVSERRAMLPFGALRRIEGFLSRFRLLHRFAENVIFVCRKANPQENPAKG